MGYVIGTDEAGYGPRYGPLVISATVWEVPGDPDACDLYELLDSVICRQPDRPARRPPRLACADSKALYNRERGLALLEQGVLAALAQIGGVPGTWRELVERLAPDDIRQLADQPWHAHGDDRLPLEAPATELAVSSQTLADGLRHADVRLVAIASRVVFPESWNAYNAVHASKGLVLSLLTLDLVARLLLDVGPQRTLVVCDKHGGRNQYRPLAQSRLTDSLLEVVGESREVSEYVWGPADARQRLRVCARAERFLPVALASMVSKYVRELAMRSFNAWWCSQLPNLRPTAGYGEDAPRFRAAIAETLAAQAVDEGVLWRYK